MSEVNPRDVNETKSDNFYRTYSNLTPHLFLLKNIQPFQRLIKLKFLSFMTTVTPKNGNETKLDIFHGIYSNLTSFFY